MKVLFVGAVLTCLLYVVTLPACQYRTLQQATTAAEQGRFAAARACVGPLLKEPPLLSLVAARATSLCVQIDLQEAHALATAATPAFAHAARLLTTHADRCQSPAQPDAQVLLEHIAEQHVAHAVDRCARRDYQTAWRVFQEIATLAYPERILNEARQEAAWCRLARAGHLAEQGWFEEAMIEIVRALEHEDRAVRAAALRQAPTIIEREVGYWLAQRQYSHTFEVFGARRQRFAAEPELAAFFPRLAYQLEMQVFGMPLAQPCLGKPKKEHAAHGLPVVTVHAQPSGLAKTNLAVYNTTAYTLHLLVRGPEEDVLQLKPRTQQPFRLAPGQYLVGLFAPGQCEVQPMYSTWSVDDFLHLSVEVLLAE